MAKDVVAVTSVDTSGTGLVTSGHAHRQSVVIPSAKKTGARGVVANIIENPNFDLAMGVIIISNILFMVTPLRIGPYNVTHSRS